MSNFFKNKDDIIKWLDELSIKEFTIHKDLTVDVQNNVFLSHKLSTLKYFPVQFGKIHGSFYCNNLELSSLKGAPYEVKGDFYCYSNNLTTLEHSPLIVQGDFNCSYNALISLKGCPDNIYGVFSCNHNNLTTLKYAPKEVGSSFLCGDNLLNSLTGCPEIIYGYLSCSNNKIKTFEGFPKSIQDMLNIRGNPIKAQELLSFTTKVVGDIYNDFGETKDDFFNTIEMIKVKNDCKELSDLLIKNNDRQDIIKRRI